MMVTLPPTPPPIPQALLDAHLPSVAPAASWLDAGGGLRITPRVL